MGERMMLLLLAVGLAAQTDPAALLERLASADLETRAAAKGENAEVRRLAEQALRRLELLKQR
jgi:hypothetical protein